MKHEGSREVFESFAQELAFVLEDARDDGDILPGEENCDFPTNISVAETDAAIWASVEISTLYARVQELEAALTGALEWMDEDGCDCGGQHDPLCALCAARAALKEPS